MAWTGTTRSRLGFRVHSQKLRKLHSSPDPTDVLAAPTCLIIIIHLSFIYERWLKPTDPNFGLQMQTRCSLSWNVVHRVVSRPGSKNNDTSGKRYERSTKLQCASSLQRDTIPQNCDRSVSGSVSQDAQRICATTPHCCASRSLALNLLKPSGFFTYHQV